MKKRILSLILTVAMMLSVMAILPISVSAEEEVATFDGTTNLIIYNNADIATFDEMVTAGTDFSGKTVTLGNDLTLLSTFDGIGAAGKRFAGTFDGQGYTITCAGHTVGDDLGSFFVGLNGATIKDVTFEGNVNMSSDFSATVACSVIGTCLIQNVRVSVYMQSQGNLNYCGGFVSCTSSNNDAELTFNSCVFDGTMNFGNQASNIGGFFALTSLTESKTRNVNFKNCVYAGKISLNDTQISRYVGCFAGYIQKNSNVVVEDCYSIGEITFREGTNDSKSNGGVIIGQKDGSNKILTVKNFYYVSLYNQSGTEMDILQTGRDTDNIVSTENVVAKTTEQIAALTAENSGFSANATFSFKENTYWDTYYPCPTGLVKDGAWVDSLMVSVDAQVEGAQIRITDPADAYSGIRFVAKFRESITVDPGTADANFGLILVSKTKYETWSALEGEAKTFAALVEAGVQVPAVKATTENDVVTVKATVYNIKAANYRDEIVAIPYVDGEIVGEAVARSIFGVASKCVDDAKATAAQKTFAQEIIDNAPAVEE